jgi:hypothetical protein
LGHLFVQALALCQAAGMVRLSRVALDGTKLRANASRRKAMSYARMSEKEKILAQELSELLADAEGIDRAEDAAFGKDARGDELPEELRRHETRLARIRAAKKAAHRRISGGRQERGDHFHRLGVIVDHKDSTGLVLPIVEAHVGQRLP